MSTGVEPELISIDENEILDELEQEDKSAQKVEAQFIDWNHILKDYGPKTQQSIRRLLDKAEVSDSDPAALVIAATFLGQLDTAQAFIEVKQVLDSSKTELSKEFGEQILALRGLISFAEDRLKTEGKESIGDRKKELLNYIKEGIALSLGNEHKKRYKRDTGKSVVVMAASGILVIVSVGITAFAFSLFGKPGVPVTASEVEILDNGKVWLDIANNNQQTLKTCIQNRDQLNNKCAVIIPP